MSKISWLHERRRENRRRCLKGGRIVLANRTSTLTSFITSESASGLQLRNSQTMLVPERFVLLRDREDQTLQCRVAWRRRERFGVRILSVSQGIAHRMKRAEPSGDEVGTTIIRRYPV